VSEKDMFKELLGFLRKWRVGNLYRGALRRTMPLLDGWTWWM